MEIIQGKIKKASRCVRENENIEHLAKDMFELCNKPIGNKSGGLALAHCQVDDLDPMRFFVLKNGRVIINPIILESTDSFTHKEGCLSFATWQNVRVKRKRRIRVSYYEGGIKKEESVSGKLACIFQHEIEHFEGKSIYDKKV